MEVKINREIRDYQEAIFFGLSLRQLVFSLLAIAVAVGLYFGLRDALGTETVSWLCILGAVPFGRARVCEIQRYERRAIHRRLRQIGIPYAKAPERSRARTSIIWRSKKLSLKEARIMIKALRRIFMQDRERITIPRSVQQTIPIKRIWPDGIWMVGNKYSKCWRFSDINYAIASKDDKTAMFLDYSEFLNALDSNATTRLPSATGSSTSRPSRAPSCYP